MHRFGPARKAESLPKKLIAFVLRIPPLSLIDDGILIMLATTTIGNSFDKPVAVPTAFALGNVTAGFSYAMNISLIKNPRAEPGSGLIALTSFTGGIAAFTFTYDLSEAIVIRAANIKPNDQGEYDENGVWVYPAILLPPLVIGAGYAARSFIRQISIDQRCHRHLRFALDCGLTTLFHAGLINFIALKILNPSNGLMNPTLALTAIAICIPTALVTSVLQHLDLGKWSQNIIKATYSYLGFGLLLDWFFNTLMPALIKEAGNSQFAWLAVLPFAGVFLHSIYTTYKCAANFLGLPIATNYEYDGIRILQQYQIGAEGEFDAHLMLEAGDGAGPAPSDLDDAKFEVVPLDGTVSAYEAAAQSHTAAATAAAGTPPVNPSRISVLNEPDPDDATPYRQHRYSTSSEDSRDGAAGTMPTAVVSKAPTTANPAVSATSILYKSQLRFSLFGAPVDNNASVTPADSITDIIYEYAREDDNKTLVTVSPGAALT